MAQPRRKGLAPLATIVEGDDNMWTIDVPNGGVDSNARAIIDNHNSAIGALNAIIGTCRNRIQELELAAEGLVSHPSMPAVAIDRASLENAGNRESGYSDLAQNQPDKGVHISSDLFNEVSVLFFSSHDLLTDYLDYALRASGSGRPEHTENLDPDVHDLVVTTHQLREMRLRFHSLQYAVHQ